MSAVGNGRQREVLEVARHVAHHKCAEDTGGHDHALAEGGQEGPDDGVVDTEQEGSRDVVDVLKGHAGLEQEGCAVY